MTGLIIKYKMLICTMKQITCIALLLFTFSSNAQTNTTSPKGLGEFSEIFLSAEKLMLDLQFDQAITKFKEFKDVSEQKIIDKSNVDRLIEQCYNGRYLMTLPASAEIISQRKIGGTQLLSVYKNLKRKKRIVNKDDHKSIFSVESQLSFHTENSLSQVLFKPTTVFFNTNYDKEGGKRNKLSTVFIGQNVNEIYMSSFGKESAEQRDIFKVQRVPNEDWSLPKRLPHTINSDEDEDYPFENRAGQTFYFSSKGHNSMGGYDIFKVSFDSLTQTWGIPENMGYPINSPFDDIAFVPNSDETEAYFTSNRTQLPKGQMTVYKVDLDPSIYKDYVLIKGNSPLKNVSITVFDLQDKSLLGVFNSNKLTGNYIVVLPRTGSKYIYQIQTPNHPIQSKLVVVPPQLKKNEVLEQIISYNSEMDMIDVTLKKYSIKFEFSKTVFSEVKSLKPLIKKSKQNSSDYAYTAKHIRGLNDELHSYQLSKKLETITNIKEEEALLNYRLSGVLKSYKKDRNETTLSELNMLDEKLFELKYISLDTTLLHKESHRPLFQVQESNLSISNDYYKRQKENNDKRITDITFALGNTKLKKELYVLNAKLSALQEIDSYLGLKLDNEYFLKEKHDQNYQHFLSEISLFESVEKIYVHEREDNESFKYTPPSSSTKTANQLTRNPAVDNNLISKQLDSEKGLYYSVQIGLFTQSVPMTNIFNLSPLFVSMEENDTVRFSAGVYNNFEMANKAKDVIIKEAGILKAFVIAFYNGRRIALAEAFKREESGEAVSSSEMPNMNVMPIIKKL